MKRLAFIAALGLAAAVMWSSVGSIQVASGKSATTIVARAHDGGFAPTFVKPIFILALGGDARTGNPEHVRTDSIHIIAIDPVSMRATIVGIPRDSYVAIPGHDQSKINAAGFFGGPKLVVQTVEQFSGCNFDYYMLTNFVNFVHLVDDFGGVTFTVDKRYYEKGSSHINLFPGTQVFTGAQALSWARDRHVGRPLGDFDRSRAQGQLMVAALAEAKKDVVAHPGTILRDLAVMLRNVKMSIPTPEALKLGLLALRMRPDDVRNIVVDGSSKTIPEAGSIVEVSASGVAELHDVCDDGLLQGP